ncbi:MAG: FecR family protein [Armatimonadota bacterium]
MKTSTLRLGYVMAVLLVGCCTLALARDPALPEGVQPIKITAKGEYVVDVYKKLRFTLHFWNVGAMLDEAHAGGDLTKEVYYEGKLGQTTTATFRFSGGPNGRFFKDAKKDGNGKLPDEENAVIGGQLDVRFDGTAPAEGTNRLLVANYGAGALIWLPGGVPLTLEPANAFDGFRDNRIWVELTRGTASILGNGEDFWTALPRGTKVPITINEKFKTEADSRATLSFPDGSLFRVKSNTILTLMNGGIQLQVGESWFNLQKQGTTFQVVTPTAVCGVLGTTFSIAVKPNGDATVRLYEGQLAITHPTKNHKATLSAGEKINGTQKGLSAVKKLAPAESAEAWERSWADTPAALEGSPPAAEKSFVLTSSSQGSVFTDDYPRGDFDIEFEVTCTQPGTIFDTMGLNIAPSGSWSVSVTADNHLAFNLWDQGPWRILNSRATISRGQATKVRLLRRGPTVQFFIAGKPDATAALPTPLSGKPIYVGDFKGDEQWGPKYRIYQGLIGTVRVLYLGAVRP